MSELALYRKYRPESFGDVLGQDHIVKVIKGALDQGNVSHAYLFSGSRGTGKTSIARIIARELGTSPSDLYEIDAASNRGIDDMRELRDGVRSLPFDSKYKVYIIDEAHMLTKEAWNAFLKTLEEPPAHVVFVLATTELEKVPETIISRCQTFIFKKPTEKVLAELATEIAKKEGFDLSKDAAELIALLGDGSFRDMHGIIQKVVSFSKDKKITADEIEEVTGAPKSRLVYEFIEALSEGDIEKGFKAVESASKAGSDMRAFLKLVIHNLRLVFMVRFSPGALRDLETRLSENAISFLKSVSGKGGKLSGRTLLVMLEAYDRSKHSVVPELPLELALVELLGESK